MAVKSKWSSDEKINSIKTSNHSITPNLSYYGTKTRAGFNGRCLKQDKVTFNHGKVVKFTLFMRQVKTLTSAII